MILKLSDILKDFKQFNVVFQGISLSNDNYIFLNCIQGNNKLLEIHNKIYTEILNNHKHNYTYIPHITLGQVTNKEEFKSLEHFNYKFESLINKVTIELIGQNEESIILSNIFLE